MDYESERGYVENRKIGLVLNETDGAKDFLIDNRYTAPAVDGSPHDYTQQYVSN